jgi:hypothetical protein
MTDNQGLLPNNVGVTSDLLYNLKPSSGRGRAYRASILPTNASTFTCGSTTILYAPCGRRGTFLDPQQSYLKYTVLNNDTANTLNFDNGAWSVINRIDIFHGSNLLESIQQANVLYSFLYDFETNASQRVGLSCLSGLNTSTPRQGLPFAIASSSTAPNGVTVAIPMLSGVIGMGLDKMLPVCALADDIRIEITWEAQVQGMVYSAAGTAWSITGVELELTYVELQDESLAIVNSASPLNETIFLHGNSWRHYVSTLPSGTSGVFSTLVPSRQASLKSLVCCPRRATEIALATAYSISSRINPNFANYWWRVGANLVPQKYVQLINSNGTIKGFAEGYMEIQKLFHSMNHPEFSGAFGFAGYNVADNSTADTSVAGSGVVVPNTTSSSYINSFAIGQNLETYSQKNDVIINGMNTLSSQVFFEANINTATATAYTLDFYANFDQILVKDETGILSVRF